MDHSVEQVADGVFRARGTDVNWYLLRSSDGVTLVDCGYPGDRGRVLASLAAIGSRPEDVRAVLITHAHVDHMGSAQHFADTYGTPVLTDPAEVAHAHRDFREQAGPKEVLANLWRPGVLPWVVRIARVGALGDARVPSAQPVHAAHGPLDLPGAPVPVPTHGHTSGHTAYHLPSVGAVITGDGLVTGHAVLRRTGPQVLPAMFNHGDPVVALEPLAGLDADLVLPGHGEPLRRPVAGAVAEARQRVGG